MVKEGRVSTGSRYPGRGLAKRPGQGKAPSRRVGCACGRRFVVGRQLRATHRLRAPFRGVVDRRAIRGGGSRYSPRPWVLRFHPGMLRRRGVGGPASSAKSRTVAPTGTSEHAALASLTKDSQRWAAASVWSVRFARAVQLRARRRAAPGRREAPATAMPTGLARWHSSDDDPSAAGATGPGSPPREAGPLGCWRARVRRFFE
jgi:hypothetical protein